MRDRRLAPFTRMSKNQTLPAVVPKQSASGIAVDPRTLERVIPSSRRSDGSVRKELKVRPGFTPQEDVSRFRGTRQVQMDTNALPKGHIIGWTPPPAETIDSSKPMSKSAKKNAKRRERKDTENKVEETVKDSWEDDDGEPAPSTPPAGPKASATKSSPAFESKEDADKAEETLSTQLGKLDVR
ncbi:hypothetical protein D9757_000091 [Collybiopsis confluens]|uniref:WIBG Mago-binding domain-containing protein n=1 Tax=Collybiopsis confluens TaxID=2823264 RepID=A0A8H5MHV8_9AGAR|nr:hypothetical protein D9757_000091 [Collybiopsis confluens]